jgi:hypothetical protein
VARLLEGVTSDAAVECTVTVIPSGDVVVVVRIPAGVTS